MALFSMVSSWARSAREHPDAPAVTVGDAPSISWRDLQSRSNQLARRYADLGVSFGDIVTLALPTSTEAVAALVAIVKLGATPNPISASLSEPELRALLDLAKPSLLVAEPGALPFEPESVVQIGTGVDLAGVSEDDLVEVISPSFKAPTSGGSTGRPKIIMSGLSAVVDDSPTAPGRAFGLTVDACILAPGPLYHNTALALILNGLSLRNHVVLEQRFDAELTLRLIERHGVAYAAVVPTMMSRMLALPSDVRDRYDLSSLRVLMHNAAPCPPDVKRAWMDWIGPDRVFENYAATEQSAQTLVSGVEWLQRPGTVGRPVRGEMEVRDERGARSAPGEVGAIWMRRPVGAPRTFRYIGEDSHESDDGWGTVGDLGQMDEDGYLYIADRRTDIIITGGANVYPAEVEGVLSAQPGVAECVVIGLPDADMGRRVHAIVYSSDPALTVQELEAFMEERLTRYKRPRSYEFVDQPLRNEAGKVRRSELVAERADGAASPAPTSGASKAGERS